MSDVDFGKRSGDYAEHRPGFPESFYDRLETFRRLEFDLDRLQTSGLVARQA